MMEQKHLYLSVVCPQCHQRACLTQSVDYADSMAARRVCPDAPADQMQCHQPCCHGCECTQNADCTEAECECDCHLVELVVSTTTSQPQSEMEIEDRCSCHVCHYYVPVSLEYVEGYDGTEGHWITNRPRECRHFWKPGHNVISTYYDNEDGRNHCLEHFFHPVNAGVV